MISIKESVLYTTPTTYSAARISSTRQKDQILVRRTITTSARLNEKEADTAPKENKESVDDIAPTEEAPKKLSQKDKLAKVFAQYGTTALVFHVSISLVSLGTSYLAVSRYVKFKILVLSF